MPYTIQKKGSKFLLINTNTGKIKGTHDTLEKAEAQERLLNAIKHNPNFKPRKREYVKTI